MVLVLFFNLLLETLFIYTCEYYVSTELIFAGIGWIKYISFYFYLFEALSFVDMAIENLNVVM